MSKKAVIPQVAAIEVAGNAVSKAGQAIVKPVVGRERNRTLTYKTQVERDGRMVEATVVEQDKSSAQVGQGVLAVAALAVGAIGVGVLSIAKGTRERIAARSTLAETTTPTLVTGPSGTTIIGPSGGYAPDAPIVTPEENAGFLIVEEEWEAQPLGTYPRVQVWIIRGLPAPPAYTGPGGPVNYNKTGRTRRVF